MILLTQKPTSIVDDKMSANTRFRWCLKVASSADSREMLHHSDAAQITTPGRAFVQVGEDEVYEQIQSYWSGAPYLPMRDTAAQPVDQIAVVDLYGNRHTYEPEKTTGYRSEKKEIDVIVDYLCAYCKEHGISKARQLWTSRLPERLYLRAVIDAAFDGTRWKGSKKRSRQQSACWTIPQRRRNIRFACSSPHPEVTRSMARRRLERQRCCIQQLCLLHLVTVQISFTCI